MILIKNQNGCHVLKKVLGLICPVDFRKFTPQLLQSSLDLITSL